MPIDGIASRLTLDVVFAHGKDDVVEVRLERSGLNGCHSARSLLLLGALLEDHDDHVVPKVPFPRHLLLIANKVISFRCLRAHIVVVGVREQRRDVEHDIEVCKGREDGLLACHAPL